MDKKALRKSIREQKAAMSKDEIEAASQELARQFFQTQAYKEAKTLYGYLSYNQEVRTTPILEQALADGKRVAVPKMYGDSMEFIYLEDLTAVAENSYGIPEPVADGPVAHDKDALVLMPGLAFDREGHRVGYGGGYYDRYLSQEPGHPLVALCYDFQFFDHLQTEEFDIPVDLVLFA